MSCEWSAIDWFMVFLAGSFMLYMFLAVAGVLIVFWYDKQAEERSRE